LYICKCIVRAGSIQIKNNLKAHKSKSCPIEIVGIFIYYGRNI